MKGRIRDMGRGFDGSLTVTLTLPPQHAEEMHALMQDEISVEIKKWREHRSLSANAYAWALITKIAQCISPPMSKEDVYVDMLKHYGQGGMVTVIKEKSEDILRAFDYYEITGEKEAKGKAFLTVKVFVGSSKYDSGEMAIFIDGVVDEAKNLGIETMTPEELARLGNR